MMRTMSVSLLLLVALAALACSHGGSHSRRDKRELLVRSKRKWVMSTIEVTEEQSGPFPREISKMFNNKRKDNHYFKIRGRGVDEDPKGVFSIDRDTGVVYIHRPIDREIEERFHIMFEVLDRRTNRMIDDILAFDVEILDLNDNPPRFTPSLSVIAVEENTPAGDLELQLNVGDADLKDTPNSDFDVALTSQEPKVPQFKLKRVDDRMVRLAFEGCFDYDKIKEYKVTLTATDRGKEPLSSTAVVTVNIVDSNTHQPTFKKTQYQAEVKELTIQRDILRVSVEDKDSPQSPGWRAKYFFIAGNEDENYQLETDPKTNEGILSVVKAKDFEKTTVASLQIGVENEEPLFVCKDGSSGAVKPPPPHTANVKVTVIDVNDAPQFEAELVNLYVREEVDPGKVLHTAKAHDEELDKIRYVLLDDPADWMTIDEVTGELKATKKMDRESPFVDKDSVYKVTVGAVDDGNPPETGTCTVLIHIADINDNKPTLVNKSAVMCGNKVNKVTVPVKDDDVHPYGGPFTFSLGGDDDRLKQRWKLDPTFGEEVGLVSVNPLPYGRYLVPLVIHDQQSMSGQDTLEVIVCDCGGADVCRGKGPLSTAFGPAAIGLLFAALLLFLLLLLIFVCQCGKKAFSHIPMGPDEGGQSLIKYNQEAGGAACAAPSPLFANQPNVTDGRKHPSKISLADPAVAKGADINNVSVHGPSLSNSMGPPRGNIVTSPGGVNMSRSNSMGRQGRDTYRSLGGQNAGGSLRYQRSLSLRSGAHIADHIQRKLYTIDGNHGEHVDHATYLPREFAYEGESVGCQSLDRLSLSNLGDDLEFLDHLGPRFKTLGDICHRSAQYKDAQM